MEARGGKRAKRQWVLDANRRILVIERRRGTWNDSSRNHVPGSKKRRSFTKDKAARP